MLQEQAVAQLKAILSLAVQRKLPALVWTVARAGAGLVGEIRPVDFDDPHTTHMVWADALGLTRMRTQPGFLTASARIGGVQVTIATTLRED
jgi:hypothetical protein